MFACFSQIHLKGQRPGISITPFSIHAKDTLIVICEIKFLLDYVFLEEKGSIFHLLNI